MYTKKRHDGTYLPNLHFFTQMLPYLMPKRVDSVIYFEQEMDVTETISYVRKRKNETDKPKITMFYVMLYAALRTIVLRPKLNRFVSGYRYYQRNRITFNFIAKKEMTDEGEEINATMSFSPLLTFEQFCGKIDAFVSSVKKGKSTGSEKINRTVTKMPRFLIKLFVWGIKHLDYHNGLPKSVIDSLPFFSTIFFTNVGSVGIDAPFHHNFDVGTCGIFCAIGKIRKVNVLKSDGTVEVRDKIKVTFTYDDRITDGIYCARGIDVMRDLIENPSKIDELPEVTKEQLDKLMLSEKELNNV